MSNAEATSKAYWEYVQTVAPDEFKDTQVLALQVHGPGVIHTVDKPVKSIADMRGLKLRAPTRQVTKLMSDANSPLPTLDSTRLLARAALRRSVQAAATSA